jgi:N-acyl-L-homoserine lactone synthetase
MGAIEGNTKIFVIKNKKYYNDHRKIKKSVFISEDNWDINVDPQRQDLAEVDKFDAPSHFCNIYSQAEPIGTIRSTPLSRGFPHKLYFTKSYDLPEQEDLRGYWTINGLAVLEKYRQKSILVNSKSTTAATALLECIIGHIKTQGGNKIWATVSSSIAKNLLEASGFECANETWASSKPVRTLRNCTLDLI